MVQKTAIFPGSFDPITTGHLDLLIQGLNVVDRLIVAVGTHVGKAPLFSFDERKELILESLNELELDLSRIEVISFDGLVVDAARKAGASILLRGLRDSTDLNYEMQMSGMNGTIAPGLSTVFLPATPETRFITASLVRQIAKMNGDVSAFVGDAVAEALMKKFKT